MDEQSKANKNEAEQEKLMKDFSAKFIATIGSEGSVRGCVVSEAMKLFDEDWPRQKHEYFVNELGCASFLDLLRKMDKNKIRIWLDEQNRLRVAVQKSEANKMVLEHIDSAIVRKKSGVRKGRSGNIIPPPRRSTLLAEQKYNRGEISYQELLAIAAAPPHLNGSNATPLNDIRRMPSGRGSNQQKQGNPFSSSLFPQRRQPPTISHAFSSSSGSQAIQEHRPIPTLFNRSAILNLHHCQNISKTYVDRDKPSNNGAAIGVNNQRAISPTDSNHKVPDLPRLTYDPKERGYFTASARIYKNHLDLIKAEKNNAETNKQANKQVTMASSSGSGGMTSLTGNLAAMAIVDVNGRDERKLNEINESLEAPIDDEDF